jgi:hypothetical protein
MPNVADVSVREHGGFVMAYRNREEMLNALLDAEIQAHRRPGMTAGQLAERLSMDELRTLYWQRKIREYCDANGIDPDGHDDNRQEDK